MSPCSSSDECSDNMECHESQGGQVCTCSQGYTAREDGLCGLFLTFYLK